jgi:hypothetical protein
MTRRTARGITIAILVGFMATGMSIAPALFIQSVFLGSAQRCIDQQEFEEAALDQVETTCEAQLGGTPFWFPPIIIAVGGTAGVVGGFLYGFFSNPVSRRGGLVARTVPVSSSGQGPSGPAPGAS